MFGKLSCSKSLSPSKVLQLVLSVLFVFELSFPCLLFAASKITQPHVEAELISEHVSVTPGVDETFALKLTPDPKWHIYWKYAGDSGSAPILNWQMNGQSVQSQILWPTPERLPLGPLVNYGYPSEVILMANLPIPDEVTGTVTVALDAEWLVCEEECIPGNGYFELELPISSGEFPERSSHAATIETFRNLLPSKALSVGATVKEISDSSIQLLVTGVDSTFQNLTFLPDQHGLIENAAPQRVTKSDSGVVLALKRPKNPFSLERFSGLLVRTPPFQDGSKAKEISIPFPPAAQPLARTTDSHQRGPAAHEGSSIFLVLLAAFAGGLILNLMPCVFPVLSIKILGFVKKAGKDPHQVRNHGLAFGAGILVSFWVLALVVRTLREAGEKLGWGFQLQNPAFVALLILLLIAVAMNLFGVFEFGSSLQRLSGSLDKEGETYSNSFLSGVLATLLATPCTAPFMGGAVAYGIQASLFPSLLVFSVLAIGLATPYLLLSFYPKLLAALPRPGAWMETFKELMGFPVLLTGLWLLWVFSKQGSPDELLALLLASILFAFALWVYGKACPPCTNRRKQFFGISFLILAAVGCGWIGVPKTRTDSALNTISSNDAPVVSAESETDAYGQTWLHFSPQLVDKLIDDGKAVYIDFTAAWCITCQVNKRLVFGSENVREALKEKGVVLVKGDWTNEDPTITEELEKFDRLGVPLNILYNPKDPKNPVVFPSVLTPQLVLEKVQAL